MSRSLLDNKYIITGEAAKCLKENKVLDCDGIDIAIEKRHVTPETLSMLKVFATKEIDDNGFVWMVGPVPVRCKFTGSYEHFSYPDMRVYGPEFYLIPNQWNDYWENRDKFI